MFTKKKKQIGPAGLLVMILCALSMMFHSFVSPPIFLMGFVAIVAVYFIWANGEKR